MEQFKVLPKEAVKEKINEGWYCEGLGQTCYCIGEDGLEEISTVPAITMEELEEMRKEIVTSFISHTLMDATTVVMVLKIIDKYIEKAKGAE